MFLSPQLWLNQQILQHQLNLSSWVLSQFDEAILKASSAGGRELRPLHS